jgi:serine/threonine-protein kinase
MDSERWERVQALFHEAAEHSAADRRAFLESACDGDVSLLKDVMALVEEDASGASFLDADVGEIAHAMLADTAEPLIPFKQIGPYRIQQVLGEGGMGVVYLARRDDLGSQVAIKVLRDAWMSPARRERFTVERRTLAQLNHPSIARLYDADALADGTPWFAMEYVAGAPLNEYWAVHACTITERLRLFRAVCEAVEYAHQHAIIHRDLKPSNILVKEDGSVRLLDFGIAKQLDPEGTAQHATRTGLRLMTPAYAAPEQIRGDAASVQTDVYGLGVILYELLTGRVPFDPVGRSSGELERMILEREAAKPSAIGGTAKELGRAEWADLDVLCLTAMHKDAARRYRSVEAFIRDLDHYRKGEPLEARADTLRYRSAKFIRRNWRTVATAAVVSATAMALVIFFAIRLATARNTAVAQAARAQRIQRFMLNLFNGGDKEAGPADNLRVLSLLDRGVQEARLLDREPVVQADLYQTLGGIYQKLGKFDQADGLLRAALEQRKIAEGAGTADAVESQVELGLLRSDQVKLDEAERLVRDGLAKAKALRPPDNDTVAKAMRALGEVLQARGAFPEAIGILEQAEKLESAGPPTPELAATLRDLAINNADAGHYEAAKALHERALAMHRQLFGEGHPSVAVDLVSLAELQQELGYYGEADRLARKALAINRTYYGNDHRQTANNLTVLGRALVFENRYDEGVDALRQALAICERAYGKTHPAVAEIVNELGSAAYMRDHLDEAEVQFERMIAIYEAVYHGRNHYQIAVGVSNLGSVYMDRKQWPRAEQYFREALQLYIATQGPEHVNTGIAHLKLGRTLLRQARYREAETQTLAAYRILIRQSNPNDSFLKSARKDLRAIYEALQEPAKAKDYQEPAARPK